MARQVLTTKRILLLYALIVFAITYAPIAMLILFSFHSSQALSFPFQGFSLRWYVALFQNKDVIGATLRSFELAIIVMALTTVIVTTTSLGIRQSFPGRDMIFYLVMLGMIVPGVVYGLGSVLFYKEILHLRVLTLWTAVPVHVLWAVPFGMLLTLARFDPQLSEYESVARTLGASGWIVFRRVTFPLIYNQISAAALFGFTLSFGELLRSYFVVGGAPTLPLYVYGFVAGFALRPDFYALGTIITALSAIILVLLKISIGRGGVKKLF